MSHLLSNVNVLAELERCGCAFEWLGDEEVRTRCPFHEDDTPSCSISISKREFCCHAAGCNKTGDFVTFLAGLLKTQRSLVLYDLQKIYSFEPDAKVIRGRVVQLYHEAIWEAKPLLKALRTRGVTDELIKQYRLGELNGRITIPITNASGLFVNIRKYLPGAPGNQKMRNTKGYSQIRLFPIDQLQYDKIVVCGGELKAIVAAAELNAHGIGAITATAGEGNWHKDFSALFTSKKVWICFDVDSAGQKAAQERCMTLHRIIDWIGNVVLPLDIDKYPHGDINDYVGQEKKSLKGLLDECEPWEAQITIPTYVDTRPEHVQLNQAVHASNATKRLAFKGIISAIGESSYSVPSKVQVTCDKSQKECALCPVFNSDVITHEVYHEAPALLAMVHAHKHSKHEALVNALGIPVSCAVCEFVELEYYNIENARLSPQLEISNRTTEKTMLPACCIGTDLELNEPYNMVGRMFPHPKTQESTLIVSQLEATNDALEAYELENPEALKIFQPEEWTANGIVEQVAAIYADLETNVTRIYQRRDMHLLMDLSYHSPLLFTFEGAVVNGWLQALIMGDSACGKSETVTRLMKHYRLGEIVECKNATVAGLIGGLQQLNNRWYVTWGAIPTHDKRLICLEELKGASVEVIAHLTNMRSSGIAEIPKIERRRTHARTRLIALSNPRSPQPMSSFTHGIEAVVELIGGLEDIRRFDAVCIVTVDDVDISVLNQVYADREQVPHVFTSDLCQQLILWAWTRKETQVIFGKDTIAYIIQQAHDLSSEFSSEIPIFDRGTGRYKLARLAAALAARTFSCDKSLQNINVLQCHAECVVNFLRRIYNSPTYGYQDYTRTKQVASKLVDSDAIKKRINDMSFPRDFVEYSLQQDCITADDIRDWCGCDSQGAQSILSLLVRKRAITRKNRYYQKSPAYIQLLKSLLQNGTLQSRPDFIEEEF